MGNVPCRPIQRFGDIAIFRDLPRSKCIFGERKSNRNLAGFWGERGESHDDELAVPERGQNVGVASQNGDVLGGWGKDSTTEQ